MLIEFSLENVFSFGIKQTLDLKADQAIRAKKNLLVAKNKTGKYYLLPTSAIFGANASGKSNVLYGLKMIQDLISDEQSDAEAEKNIKKIYQKHHFHFSTVKKPISFTIFFELNRQFYFYGFRFDESGFVEEYLVQNPAEETQKVIFVRDRQNLTQSLQPHKALYQEILNETSAFKLFLTTLSAQTNSNSVFNQIKTWIDTWYFSVSTASLKEQLEIIANSCANLEEKRPELFKKFKDQLRYFRTGIKDLKVIRKTNKNSIKTVHGQYQNGKKIGEIVLDLSSESTGTVRLMLLILEIFSALDRGAFLLFTDEFETHLNSRIVQELLSWFWDKDINSKGAQLVFVTYLQDLANKKLCPWFRPDMIQIVYKDAQENSELYCLSEFEDHNLKNIITDF